MTAPASTSRRAWPAGIVLGTGLVITLLASLYTKAEVEATQRQELVLMGNELAARVQTRLAAHAQVLRDAAAFFAGTTEVTRQEWRAFVEKSHLQLNLPGIEGIGFSLLIPPDRLPEHERLIRAEGLPDYQVWPAGERPLYTSIVYLEPFSGRNLRALGYDMYSDPVRRAAMEQARDTDRAALAGKVQLVQESGRETQPGTLMYVPVYRTGMPALTLEERRAALAGWVYSPYRMNDLMRGILGVRDQQDHQRVRLAIFDGERIAPESLLFDSQPESSGKTPTPAASHALEIPVDFHGRHWTLQVTRSGTYPPAIAAPQVLLVAVGGTVISLLLAALVWALIGSRARATQLVAELEARQRADRERRRFESELQQAREAAEAANAAKSEFLAHMSHEIRTPLNVVLGLAQVLNRESLATNQRDMVERIQAAGESLLAIINDILDLSKIEAGQLRIELRPFDLKALLARLASLMGHAAQAKGLVLRIEADTVPPGLLVGDDLRLHQVLINLVSNAIKFTDQGEVTLLVRPVEETETSVRLHFAVRDSGVGIAPETLHRLFTPFTQGEVGTTRRFGGTGLGLAICKRLVELMGGKIGAEGQPGQGSTFWFECPFARAAEGDEAAALASEQSLAPRASPCLSGVHVLVVDDSAMNRDLVERSLALEGATTTMAGDGQQAVQILQNRPEAFDAVLMDVRMPVMDGLTATRLIRTELGLTALPIITFTAGVFAEQRTAARAAGANAVLAKPLVLEQMIRCLLQWVSPRPGRVAGQGEAPGPAPVAQTVVAFPDIPGIDRVRAAQNLNQDLDIFIQLLKRFADTFRDAVELTRRDLSRGEREAAARRIHTLRGNAGTLGALDLMASASALEQAIDQGETELGERLAACGRQIAGLIEASRPWREGAAAPGPATVLPPPLEADPLQALGEDLRCHNMRALRRFEELQPALLGAWGQARTEALGRAIHAINFGEALAVLNRATADDGGREPKGEAPQ